MHRMDKKMQAFRLDERLQQRFDKICDDHGLKKEKVYEALVYLFAVKGKPSPEAVTAMGREIMEWRLQSALSAAGKAVPVDQKLKAATDAKLDDARSKKKGAS